MMSKLGKASPSRFQELHIELVDVAEGRLSGSGRKARLSGAGRTSCLGVLTQATKRGGPASFRLKRLLARESHLLVVLQAGEPVAVQAVQGDQGVQHLHGGRDGGEPKELVDANRIVFLVGPLRRAVLRARLAALALGITGAGASHAMPKAAAPPPDPASVAQSDEVRAPGDVGKGRKSVPDRVFPGAGHVAITVSSGIPHALLGDINVGVSPWFSLDAGATVSAKWNETSIFVRPRFALVTGERFDLVYHQPLAYYPKSERRDGWDWFLTNPALFVRGRFTPQTSMYFGGGVVLASTQQSLHDAFRDPEPAEPPEDWDFSDVDDGEAPETVNGIWNTFHFGVDQSLGEHWVMSLDSILIMDGLLLSKSYAKKVGPPIFAQVGVSFVF
jgi:hypothetical protein